MARWNSCWQDLFFFLPVAKTIHLEFLLEHLGVVDLCLFFCFRREETSLEAVLFLPVCHCCDYSLTHNDNWKLNEQNITHANPRAMSFTSC